MKAHILSILRQAEGVVSGEALSAATGVSRVAVWKHIQKLQSLGYVIAPTGKGYRLQSAPDALYPWEIPGWDQRLHHHEEVPSTMDVARRLARKGCPHFTVVVAERQNRGRGRLQRSWVSASGGIYFTMVLRPDLPAALSYRLSFAVSATLTEVLRRRYALDARVKWPNDILVDGRKVCGMLLELEAEGGLVSFVNVGLGINANNAPPVDETGAVALHQALGRPISRRNLLTDFLNTFEARFTDADLADSIDRWKRLAIDFPRPVRIVTTREELQGIARDVDESGALVLELADGSRRHVIYGDCFLT